ncbi:ABC transporter permease [Candidatus Saccharibacteria bacterium]|nr:ABC transporter permease [Candidatus Saccharibacteria bacterium]NIV71551.1 ABC transporter permease subunit [Calditrichia bacterium]NIW78966.1 ABC transporter permease subunit [Calditrichia bacterium]
MIQQNLIELEELKPRNRLWWAIRQDKLTLGAIIFLVLLTVGAIFNDLICKYEPYQQGDLLTERYLAPSIEHPFGTDKFARDLFSRILYGGRISLSISISVVLLAATLGILYGTISAYWGGLLDSAMMRLLDFLLAFPTIFLILMVVGMFQPHHWYLILLFALTGWMETARIVRAEVLSLKERDFVIASKGLGFSHLRVISHHIIPNSLTPVIVAMPLKIAEVILLESALSFLGLGVQPPTPSWGNIIDDGREALMYAWWITTIPGIFIALTVVSLNMIGDKLRQTFDSRL